MTTKIIFALALSLASLTSSKHSLAMMRGSAGPTGGVADQKRDERTSQNIEGSRAKQIEILAGFGFSKDIALVIISFLQNDPYLPDASEWKAFEDFALKGTLATVGAIDAQGIELSGISDSLNQFHNAYMSIFGSQKILKDPKKLSQAKLKVFIQNYASFITVSTLAFDWYNREAHSETNILVYLDKKSKSLRPISKLSLDVEKYHNSIAPKMMTYQGLANSIFRFLERWGCFDSAALTGTISFDNGPTLAYHRNSFGFLPIIVNPTATLDLNHLAWDIDSIGTGRTTAYLFRKGQLVMDSGLIVHNDGGLAVGSDPLSQALLNQIDQTALSFYDGDTRTQGENYILGASKQELPEALRRASGLSDEELEQEKEKIASFGDAGLAASELLKAQFGSQIFTPGVHFVPVARTPQESRLVDLLLLHTAIDALQVVGAKEGDEKTVPADALLAAELAKKVDELDPTGAITTRIRAEQARIRREQEIISGRVMTEAKALEDSKSQKKGKTAGSGKPQHRVRKDKSLNPKKAKSRRAGADDDSKRDVTAEKLKERAQQIARDYEVEKAMVSYREAMDHVTAMFKDKRLKGAQDSLLKRIRGSHVNIYGKYVGTGLTLVKDSNKGKMLPRGIYNDAMVQASQLALENKAVADAL